MQQIARKVSCINHSKRHQNASIIDNQNVMNNETGTCDHEKRTDRTHKYEFSKLTIVSCLWSPTGVIRVMLLPKIVLLYRVLVSRDLNNGKKWCTCIKRIWTGYINKEWDSLSTFRLRKKLKYWIRGNQVFYLNIQDFKMKKNQDNRLL